MSGISFINVDDPGHNKKSANMSPDRTLKEFEFAQAVADEATKIYARIPELVQIKTKELMDWPTSLEGRVQVAEEANADLFQSHHSNAFGGGGWTTPRGFGVYVYPGRNLELAKIAHKWCRKLLSPFGLPDRGIRERNFYVLREPTMPSVLYEWGFHTNRQDVELLKSLEYRKACAEVSVRTACEFLGVEFVEGGDELLTKHHIVQPDDTMWKLSRLHQIPLSVLQSFNKHIEDGESIFHEFGGDIVFLEKPTELEAMYADTQHQLILCRLKGGNGARIKELEKKVKYQKEKIEELEEIRLQQAQEITDLRQAVASYEATLTKIETHAKAITDLTYTRIDP